VSVGAYWLSEKWCVHRHRKQYLSFGYSFVTGKSITIILPNCIWNYNASQYLDTVQYFKTLSYRLCEVIMKMVCRLKSTSVIVNNILFESDSSYVNVQRSSPQWYCPINNANKTIVETIQYTFVRMQHKFDSI
jgi:hypothetical protein